MQLKSYYRLMRLNQPIGIWLLLWPCWWSIALASEGLPSLKTMLLFALGAVLMRSGGCIVNDIVDRHIDKEVERTKSRPLASGEVTVKQALALLFLVVFCAFLVALSLGEIVVLWAALSLLPVAIYPFMKRISWWPQLFLGFTFNWGALMGWAAVRGSVEWPAIALYIGGIFWTLGYDTIYAHQDKVDDARIGVKSTALRLGENTKPFVAICYALSCMFWAIALWHYPNMLAYAMLALAALHFTWQLKQVRLDDPTSCKRIFQSNIQLGWVVLAATALH